MAKTAKPVQSDEEARSQADRASLVHTVIRAATAAAIAALLSAVLKDDPSPGPNVHVDNPPLAVPNPGESTPGGISDPHNTGHEVSGSPVQVLRVDSTSYLTVGGDRPEPAHDPQRPPDPCPKELEAIHQAPVYVDGPCAMVGELSSVEVWRQLHLAFLSLW